MTAKGTRKGEATCRCSSPAGFVPGKYPGCRRGKAPWGWPGPGVRPAGGNRQGLPGFRHGGDGRGRCCRRRLANLGGDGGARGHLKLVKPASPGVGGRNGRPPAAQPQRYWITKKASKDWETGKSKKIPGRNASLALCFNKLAPPLLIPAQTQREPDSRHQAARGR